MKLSEQHYFFVVTLKPTSKHFQTVVMTVQIKKMGKASKMQKSPKRICIHIRQTLALM